ncbi:MAG: hypothetical protein DMF33_08210 [Verrucomicrobia bacterium]|nr:MAG: hypothetical protein DMF33_08210 [Verrucomicrobiota bacterium]
MFGVSETLPPFFPTRQLIGVHVRMTGLVPHQFHEPLRRLAFNLEHHRAFQRTQPIVHKKKRNKDRRDTDWYKPFIADVA